MFKRVFFPPPFFPSWWEEWLKPESKGREYQKKKKKQQTFPHVSTVLFPSFHGYSNEKTSKLTKKN